MAFESLSEKLGSIFKKLKSHGKLTESDIKEVMREIRLALLSADVNYTVVKDFVASVSERATGADVLESLTPAQQVIDTLVKLADHPAILEEPAKPFAALTGFGESTVQYTLRFWVKSEDYWDVLFDANARLKQTFDAAGVEMTYPHLNVHIEK